MKNLLKYNKNDDYEKEIYQIICIIKTYQKLDYQDQKTKIISQEINFIGKLEEDGGATIFFIAENQRKNLFRLFFRTINCQIMK